MKLNLIALFSGFGLVVSPVVALEIENSPSQWTPNVTVQRRTSQKSVEAPNAHSRLQATAVTSRRIARQGNGRSSSGLRTLALQLVNRDRQESGLRTLTPNELLNQVAQQHAEDMIRRGYFSHYSPEGDSPTQRVRRAGGQVTAGENIMNYRSGTYLPKSQTLVVEFQDGFMKSPGHRQMILKSDFEQFGFGIASTPDKSRIVAVQLFGLPPGQ